MIDKTAKILVCVAFSIGIFYYWNWEYFKETYGFSIFFIGVAVEFGILFFVFMKLFKGWILGEIMFGVVVAKVVDEIRNPFEGKYDDLKLAILGVVLTLLFNWIYKKWQKKKKWKKTSEK